MTEADSNVVPIRPPPPYEPEYTIERERDKLLHVAELLEDDALLYRLKRPYFDDEPYCFYCAETQRITRRFNGMAKRIRRFWGWAVKPVTDEALAEMIAGNLKVLNWTRKGSIPVLCDPQRDIAVARELEQLRIENAELRRRLSDGHS